MGAGLLGMYRAWVDMQGRVGAVRGGVGSRFARNVLVRGVIIFSRSEMKRGQVDPGGRESRWKMGISRRVGDFSVRPGAYGLRSENPQLTRPDPQPK